MKEFLQKIRLLTVMLADDIAILTSMCFREQPEETA